MLRAVVSTLKMVHFDDPALYQRLGCVYEAQKVVGEVKDALAKVDKKQYGPDFDIQYTGTYQKKLDQQTQILHLLRAKAIDTGRVKIVGQR